MTKSAEPQASPDSKGEVVRSALVGMFVTNARVIFGVLTFAALVRLLPMETHGILLAAAGLMGQIGAFDVGLLKTAEKFVAEHRSEGPSAGVTRIITLIAVATAVIASVVAGVLVITAEAGLLAPLVTGPADAIERAAWVTAALLVIVWPSQVLRHAAYGLGMHVREYRIQLAESVGVFALCVPAAYMQASVSILIVLRALPAIVGAVVLAILIRREGQQLLCRLAVAWEEFGRMVRYAISMVGLTGSTMLMFVGHNVLPPVLLGMAGVPIFAGLRRVVEVVISLNGVFKKIALPLGSSLVQSGSKHRLQRFAVDGTRLMTAVFAPSVATLALLIEPVLRLLGDEALLGGTMHLGITLLLLMPIITRAFAVNLALGTGIQVGRLVWRLNLSNAIYVPLLAVAMGVGGAPMALLAHPAVQLLTWPFIMAPVAAAVEVTRTRLAFAAVRPLGAAYLGGVLAYVALEWAVQGSGGAGTMLVALGTLVCAYGTAYIIGLEPRLRAYVRNYAALYVPKALQWSKA